MTNEPEGRRDDEVFEDFPWGAVFEQSPPDPELIRAMSEVVVRDAGLLERPNLREDASLWLEALAYVGLLEPDPDWQAHFKQANSEKPVLYSQEGELRPVRVGDHRQVFWLNVDGPRTDHGYKDIEVLDKPLRTQTAIIALLTILEANPIDVMKLREALSEVDSPLEDTVYERWGTAWWRFLGDEGNEFMENIQLHQFRYVLALLRHYRPEFDKHPHKEQLELISGASERLNSFLEAARHLVEFLEYGSGSPGRALREAAKDAGRDVRAAVLRDVEGLGSIEIAERFGLSISKEYRIKNEHKGVYQMIKRGRKMLQEALGKDGWREHIKAMKADAEQYSKLSPKEKATQAMVEEGVPVEEARRRVEEISQPVEEAGQKRDTLRRGRLVLDDPD